VSFCDLLSFFYYGSPRFIRAYPSFEGRIFGGGGDVGLSVGLCILFLDPRYALFLHPH